VGGLTPEFVAQYFIDRRAAVHDLAPVGDNRISMPKTSASTVGLEVRKLGGWGRS
jgi:hypothetical protein